MGIHWEDFFSPRTLPLPGEVDRTEELLYAPGVDEGDFLKAVRAAQKPGGRAIVPCPDAVTVFEKKGQAWKACFRAGKPVSMRAMEMAQAWLKEI